MKLPCALSLWLTSFQRPVDSLSTPSSKLHCLKSSFPWCRQFLYSSSGENAPFGNCCSNKLLAIDLVCLATICRHIHARRVENKRSQNCSASPQDPCLTFVVPYQKLILLCLPLLFKKFFQRIRFHFLNFDVPSTFLKSFSSFKSALNCAKGEKRKQNKSSQCWVFISDFYQRMLKFIRMWIIKLLALSKH